jgi:thiamine biosynthesis lipoprotein
MPSPSAARVGIGWAAPGRALRAARSGAPAAAAQQAPGVGADNDAVPSARLTEVRHIMGMPIGIDVCDAHGVDVEAAFDWLRQVDATFSTYRDDSDISRLGRGELTLAECRPEVDEVLTRCLALERATNGFFSVRAGGRLDPSGFVKGWAVDGAAERLAAAGAERFCINAGGDIVARGRPAADRLWRVGVRHPEELDRLAAVVAVEDLAVATSGEYERGAHILDPHTGAPPTGLLSVTIVGPDLATADAYATAAFAMGADGAAWTASLAGYDAMCITSDHRVLSTPGFARHRV